MTEKKRVGGAETKALSEQEELEAYAARQMWGRVRWEYIEPDADGESVLNIGPIPPEAAWEGQKEEALAAARVHRLMVADIGRVMGELDGALEEADEALAAGVSEEARRSLYAIQSGVSAAAYGLRGVLRDGDDGDDMDVSMTSLYHAILREMVGLGVPEALGMSVTDPKNEG